MRITFSRAVRRNRTPPAASSTSCPEQPIPVNKLIVCYFEGEKRWFHCTCESFFGNWLMPTTVRFLVSVSTSRWVGTNPATSSPQSPLLTDHHPLQSLALCSESLTPASDLNWEKSLSALWWCTAPRCGDKVQWRWRHEEEKGRETGGRRSLWRTDFGTAFDSQTTIRVCQMTDSRGRYKAEEVTCTLTVLLAAQQPTTFYDSSEYS